MTLMRALFSKKNLPMLFERAGIHENPKNASPQYYYFKDQNALTPNFIHSFRSPETRDESRARNDVIQRDEGLVIPFSYLGCLNW